MLSQRSATVSLFYAAAADDVDDVLQMPTLMKI